MPTDFKSLSINNFLKLQYPSQIAANESHFRSHFNIGVVESAMSNVVSGPLPAQPPMMMSSEVVSDQNVKVRLCSEDDSNSNDSDLSVGQEKVLNEQNESNNNVNVKEPVSSDVDDEEMSNASSSQYTNSSTRLCSPQNSNEILRPMHFHEEIIRSSQIYAEELLRQRIAAAARLQSVANESKNHSLDEPEPSIISKLNFQSGMFSSASKHTADNSSSNIAENGSGNNLFCAKSAINFSNIHSHLSAISQITHSLGGNMKKDDATSLSSLSRESSQSPSGFQQYKQRGFHTASSIHHQNQFHDHSLKFSIDNILKADFGRRITEPLLKTSRLKRNIRGEGKHEKEKINKFTDMETLQKEPHNSTVTKDKSLDQSFSSSAETTSKGDAGSSSAPGSSSSGTVWPAWVNNNKKTKTFFFYNRICVRPFFNQ